MTSFGDTRLNIRTYENPKWDRTRCPEGWESSAGIPKPLQMFYENLSEFGKKVKLGNIRSVTRSQISVKSKQWRVSLHMSMLQNVMLHAGEGNFIRWYRFKT